MPLRQLFAASSASLLTVALVLIGSTAIAEVTRIEISRREPFAGSQAFGTTGAYEKVVGRFFGELDPQHPMNSGIVDIDKAPRNSRGRVEYSADFYLLKPVDLTKGNGTLFHEVPNRGRMLGLSLFNNAVGGNDPTTPDQAGNGFLLRQGFTMSWSGWQPGLEPVGGRLRIEVPIATGGAGPLEQTVWDELLFNNGFTQHATLSFNAASTDPKLASLFIRETSSAAPKAVPAGGWEFVDANTIHLLPSGTPFRLGLLYQLVYRAKNPPVMGIGFAATRDWVSFLRNRTSDDKGTANPLAPGAKLTLLRTIGQGTSQSGRYLRDFIYRGFNEDEAGRKVFDGALPHIATARLFLNYRFGQPDRFAYPGGYGFMYYPDVNFPFAYETQTDDLTGKVDGILARCTARKTCPNIAHTVSSTEYWLSSQSLVTTDTHGKRDGTLPDNVRVYLIAGTQHTSGLGPSNPRVNPENYCSLPHNTVNASPAMRALLAGLERWIKDGVAPPPSRYPRLSDGTLVRGEEAGFPKVPGVGWPKDAKARPVMDYGPDFDKGVVSRVLPEVLPKAYPTLIPKVGVDGNELSGIRLPDVAVPTATMTGWVLRAKGLPAAGELCLLDGATIPLASTKTQRETAGDSRPSLEERYPTRADYADKVTEVAAALNREGYLLAEDVERYEAAAKHIPWR